MVNKLFYIPLLKNKRDTLQRKLESSIYTVHHAEVTLLWLKEHSSHKGHPGAFVPDDIDSRIQFVENRLKTSRNEIESLKTQIADVDAELERVAKISALEVDSRI